MELVFAEATTNAVALVPLITIMVQLLKPMNIKKDYLPHVSLACGLFIGVIVSLITGDYMNILAGALAGLGASGLYDLGKGSMK